MQYRRRLTLPLVESWFDLQSPAPQATARALHAIVTAVAPHLGMAVRSGSLVYDLERNPVLALVPHRAQMHLQLFDGSALAPRVPALEGHAKGMRQLRLRHGQPFDEGLVQEIVQAALDRASTRAQEPLS